MVFLQAYLQLTALLLTLDILNFRSANPPTSGYYDSLSRTYLNHRFGAITHVFRITARHDRQTESGHQSSIRRSTQRRKCHYPGN